MHRNLSGGDPFAVITHPSVLRAVIDYAWIALRGDGTVTIADAPQFDADFGAWLALTKVCSLEDFYRSASGPHLRILDLRRLTAVWDEARGIYPSGGLVRSDGDPEGYAIVDLGSESLLAGLPHLDRLYGADYDSGFTRSHHSGDRHEYCISRTVLESDVLISVPKLKMHRKVGATLNIKGLVGINGDKNYLAHYRVGPPARGGDEYPDSVGGLRKVSRAARRRMSDSLLAPRKPVLEALFVALSKLRLAVRRVALVAGLLPGPGPSDSIDCGDWSGNDTAWRMAADLLRIALYAHSDGTLGRRPARRLFSVVDGVVAGEGEGPLSPSARREGIMFAGADIVAVDMAAAEYMGLPRGEVPLLRFFSAGGAPWSGYAGDDSVYIVSAGSSAPLPLGAAGRSPTPFRRATGWASVGASQQAGGKEREDPVHEQE